MYVFKHIKEEDNKFDISDITFEVETTDRGELIDQFICFLKAVGFQTEDIDELFR